MPKIGVFDSGLGGLSVVRTIRQRLPYLDIVYLGDTARLPYGIKSPETIRSYLAQNITYLKKQNVDLVVVACNTASSALSEDDHFDLPVYNVIRAGAKRALKTSKSKHIGVIATRATVKSQAYLKMIKKFEPEASLIEKACPLFVPFVEEGLVDDPLTRLVVFRYLQSLTTENIDTLILGCTHYPFLHKAISDVLGQGIQLVDASEEICDLLESKYKEKKETIGSLSIYCTDVADHFQDMIKNILPDENFDLTRIDL